MLCLQPVPGAASPVGRSDQFRHGALGPGHSTGPVHGAPIGAYQGVAHQAVRAASKVEGLQDLPAFAHGRSTRVVRPDLEHVEDVEADNLFTRAHVLTEQVEVSAAVTADQDVQKSCPVVRRRSGS